MNGHAVAQMSLANCFERGAWGVRRDLGRALELHLAAAAQGSAEAAFCAARLTAHGVSSASGQHQDASVVDRAAALYERAAARGHAGACFALATLLLQSKGVTGEPRDAQRAAALFHQAAGFGDHPKAHYNLGVMYSRGTGVPKDETKALEHYSRAASAGHAPAACNLGKLFCMNVSRATYNLTDKLHVSILLFKAWPTLRDMALLSLRMKRVQ